MEQNFKNYKAFDYSIKTRKKMNDVDLSYVPRFLLVSVITENTYEYVEKEKKLYVRRYTDKMIPIDRIHEIICTIPTKIVLKTPIGNGLKLTTVMMEEQKRLVMIRIMLMKLLK